MLCFGLQFFELLSALIKAWFSLANAVAPHVVLPFVVGHAGALGREADKFFHACIKKARNGLSPFEEAASSWSCRGLSNFYYQKISVSNLKGLGHFFMVVAAMLRSANGVAFV